METSLLKIVSDIIWEMENQKITTVVILHLYTAFDMVNHDVLLTVFKNHFAIDGKVINGLKTISSPGTLKYVSMVTTHPQKN